MTGKRRKIDPPSASGKRGKHQKSIEAKMAILREISSPKYGSGTQSTGQPDVWNHSEDEELTDEEYFEQDNYWSKFTEEELGKLTDEEFMVFIKYSVAKQRREREKEMAAKIVIVSEDEKQLAVKQSNAYMRRISLQNKEMNKYFRKNKFVEEYFHEDIQRYDSLCVFCYGYANLESSTYKDFMQSLKDDNDKVYFARNKALAYSVGLKKELTPEQQLLKPGDNGYITKEFDTGLHRIGTMLDGDDCSGVLLTNKTEDQVLSKFREYREFDFIEPGTTPMETLVFNSGEVLCLPPSSSAKNLCPKLKKLGMPVELCGEDIKLTGSFCVCEVGKRVTENGSKILKLLERKMFNYVLLPLGYWSRITKEAECYRLDFPCRQ